MKKFAYVLFGIGFSLTGCNFVKVTESGNTVAVANAANVQGCEKVSVLTTKVRDNLVGSMKRNPKTISEELVNMARNEASDAGGDTIVPIGQPANGKQSFDVYRCSH